MTKNEKPLVSICLTFFSAEKFIYRVIESCLNQTYKNIEVVIVDDASIDGSQEIINKYIVKDFRVKHYRNSQKNNITSCFLKMFELAEGQLVMMIGADDWIARDFIENAVRVYLDHPGTAGVLPKVVSFYENNPGEFEFDCVLNLPSRVYPASWIVKRMYRGQMLFIPSAYALVRKEDAVSTIKFFIRNCCENPFISGELKKLFWGSYAMDPIFLEILSRYKNFVFDDSLVYIKIGQPGNIVHYRSNYDSMSEIFKWSYYSMLSLIPIYKIKWPRFYSGMKVFLGTEMLSTMIINFIKFGFRLSFFNFRKSRVFIHGFFQDFSFFEIVLVFLFLIPRMISRFSNLIKKKIFKTGKFVKNDQKIDLSLLFNQRFFFDSTGHFES